MAIYELMQFRDAGLIGLGMVAPTILAHAGQKIRWYVFNLDLSMTWHNFHTHAQRWQFANQMVDIRSIGPVESFIVETEALPVLLPPL